MKKILILTWLLFATALAIDCLGQSFDEFNSLKHKADSAYEAKNYALSITYYKKLVQVPESKRTKSTEGLYYDIACLYSLNEESSNSLSYLEKSFRFSFDKRNRVPVTASHLVSDTDLDFIRESAQFKNIIAKYYPVGVSNYIFSNEVSYDDLVEYLKQADYNVEIKNKTIFWKRRQGQVIQNERSLNSYGKILPVEKGVVQFINCKFDLNFVWALNENKENQFLSLKFKSCTFNGRFSLYGLNLANPPFFENCYFKDTFWISLHNTIGAWPMEIIGCSFNDATFSVSSENPINLFITNNVSIDSSDFYLAFKNVSLCQINNNSFKGKSLYVEMPSVDILRLSDNELKNLLFSNTTINSELSIQNTVVEEKVLFNNTFLTESPINDVDWSLIKGYKVGSFESTQGLSWDYWEGKIYLIENGKDISFDVLIRKYEYHIGSKPENIINKQYFKKLMSLYSMFLITYKNKNDIESYNGCFIELKELQSKRLGHLYKNDPNFETYFRWKLSQLLKFYVRHGTDPARAIVISINIIFCFGIFFFFFPSDWDVTSKKKLIQNFKDFAQKNEKGYVKPFFILTWGFAVSLLNALTLSLNAFITLGFGNIPTHGIARYVCVLEGFLGWFLLSIFTVALINQVL